MELTPSQVIVLATPVFLLLIALEFAWGVKRGRNTYRLNASAPLRHPLEAHRSVGTLLSLVVQRSGRGRAHHERRPRGSGASGCGSRSRSSARSTSQAG